MSYTRVHDESCCACRSLVDCLRRPPCYCCAPTLILPESSPPAFEGSCALALAALGEERWTGRWRLSEKEKHKLLREIELSRNSRNVATRMVGKVRRDGEIDLEEIAHFVNEPRHREQVEKLPNAVHGILNKRIMEQALTNFDQNDSGTLAGNEWVQFLDELSHLHLEHLLREAFLSFRAFFARAQPWRLDRKNYCMEELREVLSQSDIQTMLKKKRTFQVGFDYDQTAEGSCIPIPVGWWADLRYYSANNHPFHGIFACDPAHPLDWFERLQMESATIAFTFFTLYLDHRWIAAVLPFDDPAMLSLVVVTVPGIIMWWILFLLFTCRWGLVDEAKHDQAEVTRGRMLSHAGACVGHLFVFTWIAGVILVCVDAGMTNQLYKIQPFVQPVLFGRLKGYVIGWVTMVLIYFNPIVAWGQPDPVGAFCVGDLIGLGQWRIEKQRLQTLCLERIENVSMRRRTWWSVKDKAKAAKTAVVTMISEEGESKRRCILCCSAGSGKNVSPLF